MIDAKTKLCCIIGNPVEHSLSPVLHNTAYRKLGLNYAFLAFRVTDVKAAIAGLRALNAVGIVVTVPHKQEVIKYIDNIDQTAKKIGAVNTIINKNGKLKGSNTDWIGAIKALEEKVRLKDKKVAVLGAGGAARAVIYGLQKRQVKKITIFNRTVSRAKKLIKDLGLTCETDTASLPEIGNSHISPTRWQKIAQQLKNYHIIINTTSVGMQPNHHLSPLVKECINQNHVVYDIVYTPKQTKLLSYAQEMGAKLVFGERMLLHVVKRQFELFTGRKVNIVDMETTLRKFLP